MSDFESPEFDNSLQPKFVHGVTSIYLSDEKYAKREKWDEFSTRTQELFENEYPDLEFIGLGSRVVVIGDPKNPHRVITYGYETNRIPDPINYLEMYHLHNMLSTLYPENFPRIYYVEPQQASMSKGRVYTSERRLDRKELSAKINNLENYILNTLGIRIFFDLNCNNFILDTHERLKYIDLVWNNPRDLHIDAKKALDLFDQKRAEYLYTRKAQRLKMSLIYNLKRLQELPIVDYYQRMAKRFGQEYFDTTDLNSALNRIPVNQRRIIRNIQDLNPLLDLSRFLK